MKRVYVVRHAESEHHVRRMTGGWSDSRLTELGRGQAQLIARGLSAQLGGGTARVFSSDLRRAAETAEAVAGVLGVGIEWEPGLRELNNGGAAGLTLEEADRIVLPVSDPRVDWIPYAGAESWRMMSDRVRGCLETLAGKCGETAVLVTHGNAAVVVVQWWLGLCGDCQRQISFEFDAGSVTELTVNAWGERTLARGNDVRHLR